MGKGDHDISTFADGWSRPSTQEAGFRYYFYYYYLSTYEYYDDHAPTTWYQTCDSHERMA